MPGYLRIIKETFDGLVLFGTLLLNAFLIYFLLVSHPFSPLFVDKQQPYKIFLDNPDEGVLALAVILILLVASLTIVITLFRKQKLFIPAPIVTLILIAVLVYIRVYLLSFPDSVSEFDKDDYHYKTEVWFEEFGHPRIYKRWKSVQPYDGKSNADLLKYTLEP